MPLSSFHPIVQAWFRERLGDPTPPQRDGWPAIRAGQHTLIAAPTGSGKTLAAFLAGIDALLTDGLGDEGLPDETRLLYVSPLKALGNDVQKNLLGPLDELRARGEAAGLTLPEVRVMVRTGDTPAKERSAMLRRPPHVLVTTPESLYILLTTDRGRALLSTVRSVIVDEIHALVGDKRGAHLALSLERLEALASSPERPIQRPIQRIGLSATQRPIELVAQFLCGVGRTCTIVDAGHRRDLDLDLELPEAPLEAVCSHETWDELYRRMAALIEEHRTTLVFVNTRKMAERAAAKLGDLLGHERVTSHHGSLARERRLEAERRLKAGELSALVATASLELGIDIGPVDLVLQVGSTRSIATFLQRVGRAGHGVGRTPKGRLFPLTRDELLESVALVRAVRKGELDRLRPPRKPLDILAQQLVAACVPEEWELERLFAIVTRAWPYRDLTRAEFEQAIDLHAARGRFALLHRDGVRGRVRATRRARLPAISAGGAIPDTAQYRVLEEPEGAVVGSLDEDFAIESSAGDVFQLGTTSWRVLRVEPGAVRVVNAQGAPPTIPFWLGEAPARTAELSAEVAALREDVARQLSEEEQRRGPLPRGRRPAGSSSDRDVEATTAELEAEAALVDAVSAWLAGQAGVPEGAARQIVEYVHLGRQSLGAVPTQRRLILERFFDASGGMQLVLHSPFGGRVNRALGLALRKRFCRRFGFELQAAANEDAVVISLGPHHSFPLEEVFDYLHPDSARSVLVQALLAAPLFTTRWRWNVSRSLVVPRTRGGKKLPSPLLRMRADDELVRAFPQAQACFETLPPGDLEVPEDDVLVTQTVTDCLEEAMDVEGFLDVLRGLRAGTIERLAVDLPEPSLFAESVLTAAPYAFLDDAPLEERRVQAVLLRRGRRPAASGGVRGDGDDGSAELDPDAVARVQDEAWPRPESAEEVHEALTWMGHVTRSEAREHGWEPWLDELAAQRRAVPEGERWFAVEASRAPRDQWRGRLEALGPVVIAADELSPLLELEQEGHAMRARFQGQEVWCDRRLLARIRRYTVERLRQAIQPVSAATFWRFLARWQHVGGDARLEGPAGVLQVVQQLAGFEVPAEEWERSVLPARVWDYRRQYLDDLTLSGQVAWGRTWSAGAGSIRTTPVCLLPREHLELWLTLAGPGDAGELTGAAEAIYELLRERGAQFPQDLERRLRLLPEQLERGLADLVGRGLVTCDSFAGLRGLIVPPSRRTRPLSTIGRWGLFREPAPTTDAAAPEPTPDVDPADVARVLLARTGVVFKRLLAREKLPVPWRDLLRALRHLELRGDIRGGRFVAGFSGEQFALPEAAQLLRKLRREEGDGEPRPVSVAAADPLNLQGILTPDEKVARSARQRVLVSG